jgi:biotin synthase-related radical SAM superfamily protein
MIRIVAGYDIDVLRKHRYSTKERRQIEHIQRSEEARGVPPDEAKAIGYATVNKANPAKHRFSKKEDRQAKHMIDSERARGKSVGEAKRIAYATLNKRRAR